MEQGCGQRERQDGGRGSGRTTGTPPPPCAPFRIMGAEAASNSEREWDDIEDGGASLRRPAPPPPQLPQPLPQPQEQEQRRTSRLSLRRGPPPAQQPQPPPQLSQLLQPPQQQHQRAPSRLSLSWRQPRPAQQPLPLPQLPLWPPPKRPAPPQLQQPPPAKRPTLPLYSSERERGFDVRPVLQPYASRDAESSDSDDFQTPMPRRAPQQQVGSSRPPNDPVLGALLSADKRSASRAARLLVVPRRCQVAGCTADLDTPWRRSKRICEEHSHAGYVYVAGDPPVEQRFCSK